MKIRSVVNFGLFMICLVCLEACSKPEVVSQDKVIKLAITSDTTNLKADGLTVITVQAQIPANTTDAYRTIIFSASPNLGTFAGSLSTSSNTVTADLDGKASTNIVLSKVPGTYYISAQVKNATQTYKTDDQTVTTHALAGADKLSLQADNLQPLADGNTTVVISVNSKYRTEKAVTLTTNLGGFPASDPKKYVLNLDDQGKGSVIFLMSNELLPHNITATLADNTNLNLTLNPLISRPDTILAEANTLRFDTTGVPNTISTYLRKLNLNSKVTKATPVSFVAYQLSGSVKKPVGRFSGANAAISDAAGTVPTVNFYGDTGDIDTKNEVIIEVSALKTATTLTTTKLHLRVKPK